MSEIIIVNSASSLLFPNDRPYRVLLAVIQHKDSLRRRIQLARLRGEHGGRRRG